MASTLNNMLWNAMEASLLALTVALACRLLKLSAPLRHMLWLLVVVKLFVPPLVVHSLGLSSGFLQAVQAVRPFVSWQLDRHETAPPAPSSESIELVGEPDPLAVDVFVPRLDMANLPEQSASDSSIAALDSSESAAQVFAGGSTAPESPPVRKSTVPSVSGRSLFDYFSQGVLLLWLSGSLGIVAYRVWQVVSIQQVLRSAKLASGEIVAECKAVARRLGMSRRPEVKVVSLSVSPMVFSLGRPVVALPQRLVAASRRAVLRNVLAHELAHLRRRDHWVCWFELVAGCVYWWLPTFWWAGRERRRAADEAADGLAVSVLGCRRKYAESLLQTVELLNADPVVVPVLGPALGERETIARRLTMIMREPLCPRLSWPARLGVALVGLLVLPVAPQRLRAQDPPKVPAGVPSIEEFEVVLEAIDQGSGQDNPPQPPRNRRAGEQGSRGAREPQDNLPPQQRGRQPEGQRGPDRSDGREPHDPERRLRDLEAKMDQVLQALQGLQGMSGRQGWKTPGFPGQLPGMADGMGMPPGAGLPGMPLPPQPPGAPARPSGQPGMGMMAGQGGAMMGGGMGRGFGGMAGPGAGAGMMSGGGGVAGGGMAPQTLFGKMFGGMGGTGAPGHPQIAGSGAEDIGRMLGGLDLSPEQRERIERAQHEIQQNLEKIHQERDRVNGEFQKRIAEMERRRMEAIREVLTPEQRERLGDLGPGSDRQRGDGAPPDRAGGRRPEGERPRDGGGRGEGDRSRDGGDPRRRQDGDRPRGDGDQNRRPEDGRGRGGEQPPREE